MTPQKACVGALLGTLFASLWCAWLLARIDPKSLYEPTPTISGPETAPLELPSSTTPDGARRFTLAATLDGRAAIACRSGAIEVLTGTYGGTLALASATLRLSRAHGNAKVGTFASDATILRDPGSLHLVRV